MFSFMSLLTDLCQYHRHAENESGHGQSQANGAEEGDAEDKTGEGDANMDDLIETQR